jgi:hypothetical protein
VTGAQLFDHYLSGQFLFLPGRFKSLLAARRVSTRKREKLLNGAFTLADLRGGGATIGPKAIA